MKRLKNPVGFIRYLNQRIVSVGLLLALISILSFVTLAYYSQIAKSDALRVNIAGKQRMLLEQSLMYAYRVVSLDSVSDIQQAQQLLSNNLSQLLASHQILLEGGLNNKPAHVTNQRLQALFYADKPAVLEDIKNVKGAVGVEGNKVSALSNTARGIDQTLRYFVEQSNLIISADPAQLPTAEAIYQLDLSVNPSLLNKLDQAVKEYEYIGEEHTQQIWLVSSLSTLISLLVLLLVHRLLLRPYLQQFQNSLLSHEVMLENSRDLVLVCSLSGDVIDFNNSARQELSIKEDKLCQIQQWGIPLPKLQAGQDCISSDPIQKTLSLKSNSTCESEIRFSLVPLYKANYIAVFITDISHHVRHQNELVLEREVAKVAQQKAELANRTKAEFLASVSHEFRTPLNIIMGFAELMNDDASLPDEYQEFAQEILQSGQHLIQLVNNVLEYGQIESGRLECHITAEPLYPLIKQAIDLMVCDAQKQGITLDNCCSEELPALQVDADFVKQILVNLLSNAIKYNRPNGWIRVSVKVCDDWLICYVEDSGFGVECEPDQDIFQTFVRGKNANSHLSGSGLGLSICKHMLDQMNGEIGYDSEPGAGSCFWFRLPLT